MSEKQLKAVIVATMLVLGAISTINFIDNLSATPENNESENEEQATESKDDPEPEPSDEPGSGGQTDEPPAPATETPQATAEDKAAENEEQAIESNNDIEPCLLDPSDPSCPKPGPDQDCPPGWFQNEDEQCVPSHPEGCPGGYHSHEDDESGRCIPNSKPCSPGYVLILENKPSCLREEYACQEYPNADACKDDNENSNNGQGNEGNGDSNNGNNDDSNDDQNDHKKQIIIKNIHNTEIVKKIVEADDDLDLDQAIVAISYNEGAGIVCVFADDNEAQCETFTVNKDSGKEPLLQIISFN